MAAAPAAGTAAAITGENRNERAATPCFSDAWSTLLLGMPLSRGTLTEDKSKDKDTINMSNNY